MARPQVFLASDLHFATEHDAPLVDQLTAEVTETRATGAPCAVVVPGDFTAGARTADFRAAAAWLASIHQTGAAVVTTPGNHDFGGQDGALPKHDRAARRRYRQHVRNPVRDAGCGSYSWRAHFRSGAQQYDSVTVVGREVFIALRSVHKTRPGWHLRDRPPYRIRSGQLDWAVETVDSIR